MSSIITVDDLIDQVRAMIDEDNQVTVSDTADIIPALNRAQDYAASILSRHYESPMLKWITVTTVSGQNEYFLPEDAFEQRIEKVEAKNNNAFYPVKRIDYRDLSQYENPTTSAEIPYFYAVVGDKYRLLPSPANTVDLRVWYLVDPMKLVKQQGRINIINTAGNYIIVDSIGSDLTTESDNLNSYINVIDAQTGRRKATYQVQNIIGNKVSLKTVPTRSQVLNITIDNSLVTANLLVNTDADNQTSDISINADDYICLIKGSCVPFFKKPFTNFLIQYATSEIRRKLGVAENTEAQLLKDLEAQVEHSWAGREQTLRVTKASNVWRNNNGIMPRT